MKTAQQPLNLMQYAPKLTCENSAKTSIDIFTPTSNSGTGGQADGDTLINFIRHCYLPTDLANLSASDKLKSELLMAANKASDAAADEKGCPAAETGKLHQPDEQRRIKEDDQGELSRIKEPNKVNELSSSSTPNPPNQPDDRPCKAVEQQPTRLSDTNTSFLSKLAKETSSNFANFSIEAILASRRKHLTELAHLSDPFANSQLISSHLNSQLNSQLSSQLSNQLNNQFTNQLNVHLNHLQNYQHYQQANLLQHQQIFNRHPAPPPANSQPILNLHSQLFNLAAAAAVNGLDSKFHNSPLPSSLHNPGTFHLTQLTSSSTPSTTLSNGSSVSNETQSSLAMATNDPVNKFTGNLTFFSSAL